MAAGDFLDVVVEQDGIDVVVELFDGRQTKILEADSPNVWWWQEEAAWVAEQPGRYRLVVHPWNDHAAPGSYAIRVDGPRPVQPADAPRVEATREMREAAAEFNKKGREQARLDHLEKALGLWHGLGERRREAEVLHQMGVTAAAIGRMEEASACFHRALGLWDQLGLPDHRTWTLYEAGFYEREPHLAVQSMEAARELAVDLHDPHMEMLAAYRLGYSYDDLGEKQDALRFYEKALDLARRQKEAGIEANTLNGLGLVYASLGQTDKAIGLYEQALKISRQRQDTDKEMAALNNLALIYEKLDPAHARELYEKTLALGRETSNQEAQAAALCNLAWLELRTDNRRYRRYRR